MLKTRKKNKNASFLYFLTILMISCYSCKKKDEPAKEEEKKTGKIELSFEHTVDNEKLQCDTLKYMNSSGNKYMVNEVQYFISNVQLITATKNHVLIDDWKTIHYIDTDIKETQKWHVYDPIPIGYYDSITFIFGLNEADNKSFIFANPLT